MNLKILYRGELSSCNYDCPYCPFAKHFESDEELMADRGHLERFCDWIKQQSQHHFSILFTPWGEALVRTWYRSALTRLTHFPNTQKIAIQTNLSCKLDWIKSANIEKLALWCTYHPGQTTLDAFLTQCTRLLSYGVAYSVGVVGLKEHLNTIEELRSRLPAETYLWVNADENLQDYYDTKFVEQLTAIDPHFPTNNTHHESLGQECRTGHTVFSVDGQGNMRRCHFVKNIIGNIYHPNFEDSLYARSCPNQTCSCHIGYVHLEHLKLDQVYGNQILERIPMKVSR